jgi:hypothetical protein
MAGRQDVMQLLDRCDAQFLGASHRQQPRYRLPNRKILTIVTSPHDHRSWNNCLSDIRRELRDTHPELARERPGHTPPKGHRRGGSSMSEQLSAKSIDTHQFDVTQPAEFVIEDDDNPNMDLTRPEHKSPRLKKERPPAPSLVRTLSCEQLKIANDLLHSEGQAAMDGFIRECRIGLIDLTPQIQKDRAVVPAPQVVHPQPTMKGEDDMMTEMVERSQTELDCRNKRVEANKELIRTTQSEIDSDELAILTLSEFITAHERLAIVGNDVLQVLPTIQVVAVTVPPLVKAPTQQGKRLVRIDEVVVRVLPALADKTWDTSEFHEKMVAAFPEQAVPMKSSCSAMLTKMINMGSIERVDFGKYKTKIAA